MISDKGILYLYLLTNYGSRKKEMVYLMTHATHLWLFGVGCIVKDHSDSERKPAATTTWATLFISNKGSFICTIP